MSKGLAEKSYKAKMLSRTKIYKGKEFKNFVLQIPHGGKTILVSITKGDGDDIIYHVPDAKEKRRVGNTYVETEHDLCVMYAQVSILPARGNRMYSSGMNYRQSSGYNNYIGR
jgi:hypothetical protein